MVNLTINSIPVTVPEGTTILDAAASVDIEIPSLCYLKELNEISACRVCCVEVEGEGKLVPSCNNVVREGMVIRTNSPRALEARRVNMELILSQHDNKCATCIRSGTCQLQKIANDMGILGVSYPTDLARGKKADWTTTFPLYRDVNKCIKCMRCIQVCDKVQSLSVWDISGSGARTTIDVSENRVIKQADCSLCGQCITHCPTGALRERDDTQKAYAALGDPDRVTIVQIAPAVRAAWGEAFGMPTGKATVGQLVSVLRKLGADYVFDTTFSADLTIMEEGTELLQRLQAGDLDNQPMFTSCCPGWVRFLKSQFPEMTGRLSTAKSPQQMFGAVGKTWLAHNLGVDADKIYSISIMPCIAKKAERELPSMDSAGHGSDVDLVITTRELARMARAEHLDVENIAESAFDSPLGDGTGAGVIFGATGGVMEAALRTVVETVTHGEMKPLEFHEVRGMEGIKEASYELPNKTVRVCVASGLSNAKKVLDGVRSGSLQYDFIEIMGCPGGCINGGGQPIQHADVRNFTDIRALRAAALYRQDENMPIRRSHENPYVKRVYDEFLGEPGGHKAHSILHCSYVPQKKYRIE